MTGITLNSEQIRRAPPEVRRWIEHEVATSLGMRIEMPEPQRPSTQLASCTREELGAVLSLIQGAIPVVNVFFELGRKGSSFAQDRLQAYRLADIQHHTQLQNPEQVLACLNVIDESLRQVRHSNDAVFYGLDGDACFVATQTQQNIRQLWFELIGRGAGPDAAVQATHSEAPEATLVRDPDPAPAVPAAAGPLTA